MRRFLSQCFLLTALALAASPSGRSAERIVVIAAKKSAIPSLTQEQIKSLFLGETRLVPGNIKVVIGDRERELPIQGEFYQIIAGLNTKDVAVHWARKVFTGAALPPARIRGDDTMAIKWVKDDPEHITYIYARNIDSGVKVVGSLVE